MGARFLWNLWKDLWRILGVREELVGFVAILGALALLVLFALAQ